MEQLHPVSPSPQARGGMREALCTKTGNVPFYLPTRPDKAMDGVPMGGESGEMFPPIGQIPVRVNRQGNEAGRGVRREAFPVVFPEH